MPSSSDCDLMEKESLLDVISQDEVALEHGGPLVQHNWRVLRRREETQVGEHHGAVEADEHDAQPSQGLPATTRSEEEEGQSLPFRLQREQGPANTYSPSSGHRTVRQ